MKQLNSGLLMIVAAVGLIALSQSVYTVDQRQQAIVLQLGQPVGEIKPPGLHFKIPMVQDVRRFDRRVLSVDLPPSQMVVASSRDNPFAAGADKDFAAAIEEAATAPVTTPEQGQKSRQTANASGEPVMINTFARYKITDPLAFMKTLGSIEQANSRLEGIINDATRGVLGNSTLWQLLSQERTRITGDIRNRVNTKITEDKLGIEIIDIRIVRADLTGEQRQATVRRMISELQERATQTRALGAEKALEIRSTAEKEREIIIAEAQRDAQMLRGDGDKEAIGIYAASFNQDKEFYGFMRSLEAYRNTLASPETRLILSPDSDFFKHFGTAQ
jgi:membrane protease subunit HflC